MNYVSIEELMNGCFLRTPGDFFMRRCSIVGKLLCYHASNPDLIPRGVYANRCPKLLALLGQLCSQ